LVRNRDNAGQIRVSLYKGGMYQMEIVISKMFHVERRVFVIFLRLFHVKR
jgi:hypothetical protein